MEEFEEGGFKDLKKMSFWGMTCKYNIWSDMH